MDGIELACRFSYQPNKLRYCGPSDANKLFLGYIKSNAKKEEVVNALKHFEAAWPYYELIAKKSRKIYMGFGLRVTNPIFSRFSRVCFNGMLSSFL